MVDSVGDQPIAGPESEQNALEDHIALIYETTEERLAAITPLIKVGLEKGELCLYISNEENDLGMVEALKAEHIDVEKAVGTGGLILTSKKEIYFKLGRFDPDWTIRVINNIADLAKSYGFTAMRIMSEMTWTQEKVPGVEKWPEYEAKMNALKPGISLRIICQYDSRAFPPEAMMAAIKAHPKVVSQGAVSRNSFYIPSDLLLKGNSAALELERMLDSIRRSNHSEAELQNRDQLIDQMRKLVDSNSAARRKLEIALEESRRRFDEFADRASDWAWEMDDSGSYTYSSSRVRDILGFQPEEILGRKPLDLVSQEEADRVSAILTKAMGSQASITALEKEVRHKDGHSVFLEMNGTPMFDRDGKFQGYRGIDRDITGRKAAKQAIDESRRKAEDSLAEVQARDQRIQALEEDIAQLKSSQEERNQAITSIQEALKSSQMDLAKAGEDLGRLGEALRIREEEVVSSRATLEARQAELDAQRSSLSLLQQNLLDKEKELNVMRFALSAEQTGKQEKEEALADLSGKLTAQVLELTALRGSLEGAEEAANRKNEELILLRQQMERMEADLLEAKEASATKERAMVELQTTLAERERELGERMFELGGMQEQARTATEELTKLKADLSAKETLLGEAVALSEAAKADLALRSEEAQQASSAKEQLEREKEQLIGVIQEKDARLAEQQEQLGKNSGELKVKEEELAAAQVMLAEREHASAELRSQEERLALALKEKEAELVDLMDAASTKDRGLVSLHIQLDQQASDLKAKDDEIAGLREALRQSEQDIGAKIALLGAATIAAEGKDAEISRLQEAVRDLEGELKAVREVLGSKDQLLAQDQEALSESNDRYRAIFEQAGVGIVRIDLDGRMLEANEKFYDLLGYTPGELVGKTFRDITHRDDLVASAAMYQRLTSGEISSASAFKRYVRKLGSSVWANVTMSMAKDGAGKPRYIMAIIDDRTDQMLAEQALREKEDRESEERYKNVIENAPEGVWVLDTEGRTTFVNQRMAAMLGCAPDEIIGRSASEFMDPQWKENQEKSAESPGKEIKFIRKDGTGLWVIVSSMPILDQAGQDKGAIGLVSDITYLKTKEAAPELAKMEEKAVGPAAQPENLAHDLNDSLTVIMGSVSLAKEYVIPEGRMYSKLKQIESASETARDLANRLMAGSKGGAEGKAPSSEPAAPLVKGKGKILLMDDEESILEATGDLLRYLGYAVEVARDGDEALEMCREARSANQPFALAILDLAIASGMGGKEAGQKLRVENPDLKLIVSSGYIADPVMTEPSSMGFSASIPKPYAAVLLSKVVAEVLAKQ